MADQYLHGIRVTEVTEGTRPIRTVNSAIIGLVATADDADADTFPLNRPVLITGTPSALGKAGTTGTLAKALDGIFDQIAPMVVVVRVEEGADAAETTSNAIGGIDELGKYTGLQALLAAKAQLGVTPRILGAPGLDVQAVVTELVSVADKLRAFVYAAAEGLQDTSAVTYRGNFGSKRLMLIWPEFEGWDTETNTTVTLSATARALGLRAKLDNDIGWHKTLSNVPVSGVTGLSADIYFDIQNPSSQANYLNSNEVTTLIQFNGFRFWGSRTCSIDPKFAFESATRTGDILADTIAEAHAWAIDKPMHRSLINDIVEGINAKFREMKALGYIVDGTAWVDPEKNGVESLEAGKLYIDYDYTPVPPLENLNFTQKITNEYLIQLVS